MPEPRTVSPAHSPLREIKAMVNSGGVWAVGILLLTNASFIGMLEALYPLYLKQHLDFSRTWISIFFAIISGAFMITMPVAGRFSSTVKPFPMIATGLAIAALTTPGLVFLNNTILIAGCLAFNGLGWALCLAPTFPLFTALVTRIGSHLGIAFGLSNVFFAAGFMLGPMIGTALMQIGGIRMSYVVFSIMMSIVLIFTKFALVGEAAEGKSQQIKKSEKFPL